MRIVLYFIAFTYFLVSQEIVLKPDGKYKIYANVHLVNNIPYKKEGYNALIEIPAGTTSKWEVNHRTGHLEWEFENNKPRNIKFLGYPGNYGYIPQTILDKSEGGDGDPLDVIVLDSNIERGSIQKIKILGAIKLLDEGEQDDKIIAVTTSGPFAKVASLAKMMIEFPGSIQIIRLWFEGYDKGSMKFMGYMNRNEAEVLVEKAHKSWGKQHNVH